eukprot:4454661-Pleurochrysis_carterae.AAC.3
MRRQGRSGEERWQRHAPERERARRPPVARTAERRADDVPLGDPVPHARPLLQNLDLRRARASAEGRVRARVEGLCGACVWATLSEGV